MRINWASLLGPGERLVWQGRPDRKLFVLRKSDIFLIPFSLMWGGFAIFWEISVLSTPDPLPFALFGLPFVAIGLYIMFGRFLVDAYVRHNTDYALTNKRAIIATTAFGTKIRSKPIGPDTEISFTPGPAGSIRLGTEAAAGFDQQNWAVWHSGGGAFIFERIFDADQVYKLIRKMQET